MTPAQTPTPIIVKIAKFFPMVEKVFLTALAIGIILTVMKSDSSLIRVALLGLGVTFFLMAYRPTDLPIPEGEKLGFQELLGLMIVPKVLWISSAISTFGIAFYLFDFGNDGYKQMLMVGRSAIAAGTLLMFVFFILGVKYIKLVMPILFRAVPLCAVSLYLLFN